MKQLILVTSLASLFNLSEVNAQPLVCPFTDYFIISSTNPSMIASLSSEGNVFAKKTDPLNFVTSCRSSTSMSSGTAYVTVKSDENNVCTLHILDGPYEMNPNIIFINCVGNMRFSGMDHVWGTYTYTLKFSYWG